MHLSQIKNIVVRLIFVFVAFQILNLSVHGGDFSKGPKPKDTRIGATNQVDCFVEFVYEDICNLKGYDDLHDLALHNKTSSGHKALLKFIDFQMPVGPVFTAVKAVFYSTQQTHFPKWDNKYAYLFARKIIQPPKGLA